MIRRVLVANRGEIAVRVIRACRDLGIATVQSYSDADAGSLAVKLADQAVNIGPAPARQSYLNPMALIGAALLSGCDAVHPGYGFLSENAEFAELCARNGLVFVGPQPDSIRSMGDKAVARALARDSGVPTVPGSDGAIADAAEARRVADSMRYPVLLKAAAGGGGKGMRVVESSSAFEESFLAAQSEAQAAFGDGRVYLERYLTDIRHVEVQVLGDGERVIHVGERDCTIQRRHQKLVEESPSPAVDARLRAAITAAAVQLAAAVRYRSVGTVEFVLDNATGEFYFIEMNTRLQVEHPVTEMVTGIDLVAQQLRIASGERLSLRQEDVAPRGHAIECRINAEDPARGFLPQPGTISAARLPAGAWVRVDSHVFPGCVVPPYYDSLLAKLVTWGASRDEAIVRMRRALAECRIEGVATNIDFQAQVLDDPRFRQGAFNTAFVESMPSRQARLAS